MNRVTIEYLGPRPTCELHVTTEPMSFVRGQRLDVYQAVADTLLALEGPRFLVVGDAASHPVAPGLAPLDTPPPARHLYAVDSTPFVGEPVGDVFTADDTTPRTARARRSTSKGE